MIAVTGATGLLGQFIVRRLVELSLPFIALKRQGSSIPFSNDSVTWRVADICDPVSLNEAFADVSLVIHAAAFVSFNRRERNNILRTNVEGTRNVVDACLNLEVKRLIHVSSVAALGRHRSMTKIDEESKWADSHMNSDYAESKHLSELEVFRGQEEGLHIDVVNPSVILAPSNERRSSAQLFHYVKKQRLFYTSSSINFVDVRDVVDLIFKLIDQPPTGKRFIVNGGTVEIKHLFDAIATRLGKRPPKVKLGPNMLHLIATLESIRSGLTGSDPLISRQSIKSSLDRFEYSSLRAVQDLGMQFRPLNETLDWCCPHYANAYNKQSNPAS